MRCSSRSYASSPLGGSLRGGSESSAHSAARMILEEEDFDGADEELLVNEEVEMSFSFDQLVALSKGATEDDGSSYDDDDEEEEEGDDEEVRQYREFSEVASSLLGAPMARVSAWLAGSRRSVQVLASHGFEPQLQRQPQPPSPESSSSSSFEEHAVQSEDGMLVVEDAALDARFQNLHDVRSAGIRFCAAVAVVSPRDGSRLGAVCVMDTCPRPHGLCEEELTTLQEVAAEVADLMEKRRDLRAMEERSWASAPTPVAALPANRPTNVAHFLRLLELLAVSFAKRVSVYLSVEGSVPETLTFNEAEAFGSALAVLKSACDGTDSGYIHLRMSLKAAADGTGDCLVFECESTAAPEEGHDMASSSSTTPLPLPCLPVIANYMNSVGGRCGAQTRAAPHQRRGSLVWFSLPVAA